MRPPRTPQPDSGDDEQAPDPSEAAEEPEPQSSSPRQRMDRLSIAAISVIALAVAIFATLVIVEVFGTSEDDGVDVRQALGTEGEQSDDETADDSGSSFSEGEPAPNPDFQLLGGGSSSVSDFLGKPLVINFWSSTCAPCLAEMPDFEAVNQQYGGEITFLGVDVVDTEESGIEMVEQTGITYPSARDPKGEIFNAFAGTALPRTVILDGDGIVIDAFTGEMDAEGLNEALETAGLTS